MKKFYKIFLLVIVLTFSSTYNPKESHLNNQKNEPLFQIENIEIKNNFLIKEDEIEKKLKKIYKKNIFFIKINEIEELLIKLDFFKKIEVKKKYPNTIIIKIFETTPVAIIFKDQTKYLIDSMSNLILPYNKSINYDNLPEVFGEGAENNFINFLNQLKKNNFSNNKIESFYYFKIGRWDLKLFNNKVIKLPYKDVDAAIIKSIELLNRDDFKNYNIIDLRVDGKIIVE